MCSVGDEFREEVSKYMELKSSILPGSLCIKCRTNESSIVLRSKDAYCKDCFLAGTTHKFKALLGKNKLIRPNDKVLISYTAGHVSTTLLHFVRTGLDLSTPKRLKFLPYFVFIEPDDLEKERRLDTFQEIQKEVDKFGFPLYFVSASDFVSNPDDWKCYGSFEEYNERKTVEIVRSVDGKINLTNRQNLTNIFLNELLIKTATKLECKFCFTTELSSDIAQNLLTNVSIGRGVNIPLDVGLYDNRDANVTILRPMRNLDLKEVEYYNQLNNLTPVFIERISGNSKSTVYDSVHNLIGKFVTDLQLNYPATISTVVKTGNKLAMNVNVLNNARCHLCKAPVEIQNPSLCSAESTNFSHWVSTQKIDKISSPINRYDQVLDTFSNNTSEIYCFSCEKIAKYIITE